MTDDLNDSDMKELLKDLPRSIEPDRDLYPAISARIAARGAERRRRRVTAWLALAASVALVVTSSLITSRVIRSGARPPVAAALPADARIIEAGYVQATQDLENVLASERSRLAPATVKVVEQNLITIDRAIRESRDALARDPGNREAARLLWSTYRQKLDLLQRVARLDRSS